jgi:hypothetical protein
MTANCDRLIDEICNVLQRQFEDPNWVEDEDEVTYVPAYTPLRGREPLPSERHG